MNLYNTIRRPVLGEKADRLRSDLGQYVFVVDLKAEKQDVKLAVEELFGVKVASVRTLVQRGKLRRRGMYYSKTPKGKLKKAVVKLQAGETIKLFDV